MEIYTSWDNEGNIVKYNENGELIDKRPADVKADFETMQYIEKNSNYEFSTTDKIESLADGVADEAIKTGKSIDEVLTNVGSGFVSASYLTKYLPFILIAGLFYKFFLKENKKNVQIL